MSPVRDAMADSDAAAPEAMTCDDGPIAKRPDRHRPRQPVADLLAAHRLPAPFAETERAAMAEVLLAPTANRSVVGVLNEFTFLSDVHRADPDGLLELSLRLAATPLGPLYQRHVSPDRELTVLVAEHATRRQRGGGCAAGLS